MTAAFVIRLLFYLMVDRQETNLYLRHYYKVTLHIDFTRFSATCSHSLKYAYTLYVLKISHMLRYSHNLHSA